MKKDDDLERRQKEFSKKFLGKGASDEQSEKYYQEAMDYLDGYERKENITVINEHFIKGLECYITELFNQILSIIQEEKKCIQKLSVNEKTTNSYFVCDNSKERIITLRNKVNDLAKSLEYYNKKYLQLPKDFLENHINCVETFNNFINIWNDFYNPTPKVEHAILPKFKEDV